jgi:uncharacterized protein (DUF1778 family)
MERKSETLNLRVSPELKGLLRLASMREHRTLSNMVEFLVRDHCDRNRITAPEQRSTAGRKSAR